MDKTLIIWRRLGKEHGETPKFVVNTPDVVDSHLQDKLDRFRATPDNDWRWWQVSDDLLVERPFPDTGFGPDTCIYYLPRERWVVVENSVFPGRLDWPWYIHIGDTVWNADL